MIPNVESVLAELTAARDEIADRDRTIAIITADRDRPLADRVVEWLIEHGGPLTEWQEYIVRRTYTLAPDGRPWFGTARPTLGQTYRAEAAVGAV